MKHWDMVLLGVTTVLIAFMTYCGPAQRPDCLTPEAPVIFSAGDHDDE